MSILASTSEISVQATIKGYNTRLGDVALPVHIGQRRCEPVTTAVSSELPTSCGQLLCLRYNDDLALITPTGSGTKGGAC